jgi:predicted ATP-grasp superfamily ATP-dependent carboligase
MLFSVLVLDANQRSALAVTRSLGRIANFTVTTADSTPHALAGCSHFSSHYLQSPSSESAPDVYINWLTALQVTQPFDLVIPVTEITSQLLLMNSHRLNGVKLPFASYETVMQLADKGKLVDAAVRLGIPCPVSRKFDSAAALAGEEVSFPVVLKPCLSKIYTADGWIATTVRVLSSKAELEKTLHRDAYLHHSPFMLQEFIPGHGAGVFCLYDKGMPLAFFAHRRLREKPPQGGVSVLSESVAVDPLLKQYATRLLGGVNWHGVAMVEFRIAPDGTAYLMEVNTRFWGSLQLAIDAGVDFPALLVQAERSEQPGVTEPLIREPVVIESYVVGQRLRWLLGDIDSLYLYLKSRYTVQQKLLRLMQFFTPRLFKCRHEINRWGDFAPARHELKLYLQHLLGR